MTEKKIGNKFGTFKGVFLPSMLTILGLIMYLRTGWVIGHVGIVSTILIITLSTSITFLTSLSISATATNMKVGAGGAYYMISRSLGLSAGGAIGLPLYLAQTLGIAFYLTGFAESVNLLFPDLNLVLVSVVSLIILTLVAYISADIALKIQFLIFLVIVSSLVSLFLGDFSLAESVQQLKASSGSSGMPVTFWIAFAIFFPAVTGIEAGIALSGELKTPSRSLPLGTILAVVLSYFVYIAIAIFLAVKVPLVTLRENTLIMKDVAIFDWAIIAGIWGATLSSALGALLGAPRTLQALAQDGILPKFFAKSLGKSGSTTPHIATAVSFVIAFGAVLIGKLDLIAPVLSMFFLTSYGFLNLAAGIEGFINNPSWRPSFDFPYSWLVSLFGAGACFAVMFMINPGATIIAIIISSLVFLWIRFRRLTGNWQDAGKGIWEFLAYYSINRLSLTSNSAKNWRPNLLVLSGSLKNRWHLIEFGHAICANKGFLTIIGCTQNQKIDHEREKQLEQSIKEFLQKKKISALVDVQNTKENIFEESGNIVQYYGLGTLVPNTVLLGKSRNNETLPAYISMLRRIYQERKNILILHTPNGENSQKTIHRTRKIFIWWGRQKQNANLMMAIAQLMTDKTTLSNAQIYLKTLVNSEQEAQGAKKHLEEFIKNSRINAKVDVILNQDNQENRFKIISENSKQADLVFLGLKEPEDLELDRDYLKYYQELLTKIQDMPKTCLVLASEEINFDEIFV